MLIYLLKLGFLPSVFGYVSTRMVLAAITSLLLTICLGPFFIRKLYEMKVGQTIRSAKECPLLAELHGKKSNTPTMGGVLILFSIVVSLLLWMDLKSFFTWVLAFSLLAFGTVGMVDDLLKLKYKNSKGLSGKKKFFFQTLFAGVVAFSVFCPAEWIERIGLSAPIAKEFNGKKAAILSGAELYSRLYVPFYKKAILVHNEFFFRVLFFVFFVFIIVGSSNAVNLTDGLDGLACGLLVMVAAVLALFGFLSNHIDLSRYLHIVYLEGSGEIAVFLFGLAGAVLGFLWYNSYPAQVFMGDMGSLALGGVLGVAAVLLKKELLLGLVGGVFVAEVFSVILQVLSYRYRNKKRIFRCAPLHHHFEYKGWSETKVVLRFWIVGLIFALIGIASLKFQ